MDRVAPSLADTKVLDRHGAEHALSEAWKTKPAVLVFLRHFGCGACREQVALLRPHLPAIRAKGADLYAIGNGSIDHLDWFIQEMAPLDFQVWTDPTRKVFEHAGMKHGKMRTVGPKAAFNYARGVLRGFANKGGVMGDAYQQGGAMVVLPGGKVTLQYAAEQLGEHTTANQVLAALP